MSDYRLAVVGGGNMARAILTGVIETRALTPQRILLAEPDASKRRSFTDLGVQTVERADAFGKELGADAQVMLAVKPQLLAEAAADLGDAADGRVVISILAGSTSARIRKALGGAPRIVRVMPNLPASIRMGVAAVALGEGARQGDQTLAETLMGSVGEVVPLNETMMDAFTALAGSGPAYLFYLAEAMERAAHEMGFDDATASRIARGTLRGAGEMLFRSEDSPAALRAAVTSRKGTTDAAITSMEADGVRDAIVRAALRARDRGAELAKY